MSHDTSTAGVRFDVEDAGCESCAARVRGAIEPLAEVAHVAVDHDTEITSIQLAPGAAVSEEDVERALAVASEGTPHTYKVRAGSWAA